MKSVSCNQSIRSPGVLNESGESKSFPNHFFIFSEQLLGMLGSDPNQETAGLTEPGTFSIKKESLHEKMV
jgi:hypothetical protein